MLRTEWFKNYIPLVFIFLKQARPVASKLFLKSQLSGRLTTGSHHIKHIGEGAEVLFLNKYFCGEKE